VSHFDYTSLTASVDPADVTRLRDESKKADVQPTEFWSGAPVVVALGSIVLGVGMMAVVWAARAPLTGIGGILQIAFFIGFGAAVLFLLLIVLPASLVTIRTQWASYFRAQRFAATNDLAYAASEAGRAFDGAIFNMPRAQNPRSGSVFRAVGGPEFEVVGHYHYTVDEREIHWGYIAVDLGRPLPHLVVRGKRRGRTHRGFLSGYAETMSTIPLTAHTVRKFTVYGAPDSAGDARELFTDRLLDSLTRLGRGIDAETLGTRLFVYSSRPLSVPRPKAVRRLFEVVDLILDVRG
jgi:hypothetical protein